VKLAFHHDSLALETAAYAGCSVCSIYRRDIRNFAWDEFNGDFLPSKDDVLTLFLKKGSGWDTFRFEICVYILGSNMQSHLLEGQACCSIRNCTIIAI
jgi:hypothetical protein